MFALDTPLQLACTAILALRLGVFIFLVCHHMLKCHWQPYVSFCPSKLCRKTWQTASLQGTEISQQTFMLPNYFDVVPGKR